ncbi:sulfotransferase domain-containing protein [Roseovarius sp. D22-M7]|uniref:sulfotransferase domain-containing protein n=1 Tax=Roseovarius sp. D22-M7 TaxID=3127116 RepID=UPI00300FFBBE
MKRSRPSTAPFSAPWLRTAAMALGRSRVIGIYSYPKSGNTWLRSIIGAQMQTGLKGVPDTHRESFSDAERLRGAYFYKYHGRDLRPFHHMPIRTSHVIHIRRNPLDVFLSYLNYLSDKVTGNAPVRFPSVEAIAGTPLFDAYFSTFVITGHLTRLVAVTGDYFDHNATWLARSQSDSQICCLRYEDMLQDPVATLSFLQDWIGVDEASLASMVQAAEHTTRKDNRFFWRKQERNFLNFLSPGQIAFFLEYRGAQAEQLGYDASYFSALPMQEAKP